MKKIILLVVISLYGAAAHASGCGWTTRYEPGPKLADESWKGKFFCFDTFCRFDREGSQTRVVGYVKQGGLPPTDLTMELTVAKYEAMEWQECEPGDEPPAFEANGYLYVLEWGSERFEGFDRFPRPAP